MTQLRFKVKRGDFVQVITGRDKGKRGIVLKVFLEKAKALVQDINTVFKNVKVSQENPDGGKVKKTLPIHISNIAIVNPLTDKPEKVGIRLTSDGKKEYYFKKTGNTVERIQNERS